MKKIVIIAAACSFSVFLLNFSSCSTNKSTEKTAVINSIDTTPLQPRKVYVTRDIAKDDRPKENEYLETKDSVVEITMNLVGDLMCHMPQTTNSKTENGYDFNPSFEYVKPYLSDADVTIGNLELTTAGTRMPFAGYPAFNAPDQYVAALRENGFDFLVMSNNHSMDTGEEGLLRTIEQVKKNNLGYTGTFSSQSDHDSIRVLNVKGIRIAVLNYTYGTNGAYPTAQHKYMLNVIDSSAIFTEVKKAKLLNPDFILVFYHYGTEYVAEPIESQKKAVKWAREAGANIVIGAHPHVVGPLRWLEPDVSHPDTCFVAWSLGNFFSNQNKRYTDAGVILTLHLSRNLTQNRASVKKAEFVPTWVYRGERTVKKKHIILPSAFANDPVKIPTWLDSSLVKKMKQAYDDTQEIINKYGPAAAIKPIKP